MENGVINKANVQVQFKSLKEEDQFQEVTHPVRDDTRGDAGQDLIVLRFRDQEPQKRKEDIKDADHNQDQDPLQNVQGQEESTEGDTCHQEREAEARVSASLKNSLTWKRIRQ